MVDGSCAADEDWPVGSRSKACDEGGLSAALGEDLGSEDRLKGRHSFIVFRQALDSVDGREEEDFSRPSWTEGAPAVLSVPVVDLALLEEAHDVEVRPESDLTSLPSAS